MNRSGYMEADDFDLDERSNLWRGAVHRSILGKRGQSALRQLLVAMDALPEKVLAADSLVNAAGEFCTLGVLGQARGLDMSNIDPYDWESVAKEFNLAPAMIREIVYHNDEVIKEDHWEYVEICGPVRRQHPYYECHFKNVQIETTEEQRRELRWKYMRKWVSDWIELAEIRSKKCQSK